MWWKAVKHYPQILSNQEEISYPDVQKLCALVDMSDDTESAINAYYEEKIDLQKGLNGNR